MKKRLRFWQRGMGTLVLALGMALGARPAPGAGPSEAKTLNDDGGWCWFQDERAIVVRGKLFFGSVATGREDPERKGNVEVTGVDLRTGETTRFVVAARFEADDHAAPALLALPDDRLLVMYARHGPENRIYWRVTERAADATAWGPEQTFIPSARSRVTYSNLHWLPGEGRRGRIYNFFRGYDNTFKPSWMYSDDRAATWTVGGVLIDVPTQFRHRPYVKYASDGGAVHLAFTEGHPRNYDNSIYHARLRKGVFERANGSVIRRLAEGPIQPKDATQVFLGDPDNVAWIQDIELDRRGRVRLAFSVQKDSAGLPPGKGGKDHRYHWAEWDGRVWWTHEIARAGSRLYAGEDDYVGGIALHPDDPDVVLISANVDPVTGTPTRSGHYEIFHGKRIGREEGWRWTAWTPDATEDQLRPMIPKWRRGRTAALWLSGRYRSYTDYDLAVVGRIE
jgi:hypothetical protein